VELSGEKNKEGHLFVLICLLDRLVFLSFFCSFAFVAFQQDISVFPFTFSFPLASVSLFCFFSCCIDSYPLLVSFLV
jgi:hypothetical protein